MASVSSVDLVPIGAIYSRSSALSPVDARSPSASFEAEPGFRVQPLQAETLREASSQQAEPQPRNTAETQAARDRQDGRQRPFGNGAPFLTQLLAQDQPVSPTADPFAQAARAYGRFKEAPSTGFVLDAPARIDVRA